MIIGVVIGLGFVLLGTFATFYIKHEFSKTAEYKETEAIIVDVKMQSYGFDDWVYNPVVEFYVDNKKITSNIIGETYFVKPQIHKKITIKYNPEKPEDIIIKKDKYRIYGIIIVIPFIIGIGLTMIIMSLK